MAIKDDTTCATRLERIGYRLFTLETEAAYRERVILECDSSDRKSS